MSPTSTARPLDTPTGLGWALLAVTAALPYLAPPAGPPWIEFYRDAAIAALWLLALAAVAWRAPGRSALPIGATTLLLLSTWPLLQAAAGLYNYPGEAAWASLTLCAIGVLVALAAWAQRVQPLRVMEALLASVVVASIASVGLAMAQWLQVGDVGHLIHRGIIGGQPGANLGQPNLLATLLLWGGVGLWWGHWRRRIGPVVACIALAFLGFGVVMTQSRTGLLGVLLLVALAWTAPVASGLRPSRALLAALAVGIGALALAWPGLNAGIEMEAARSVASSASAGKRPLIWQIMWDAAWQRPWMGHGWNQGIVAQIAVAADHPPLGRVNQFAHNLLLDLMVWNGIPLGLALGTGCVGWFAWRLWRVGDDAAQRLVLAALAVFGLHAMLELPHAVALFFVPAAVMVGTVEAMAAPASGLRVPQWTGVGAALGLLAVLAWVAVEYRAVEAHLMAHRLRQARIGNVTPPPLDVQLLRPLQDALEAQRIEPRAGLPAQDMAALERSATRYPALGALYRAALAARLNGQGERAEMWLVRVCRLHPPEACDAIRQAVQEAEAARGPTAPPVAASREPSPAGPAGLVASRP